MKEIENTGSKAHILKNSRPSERLVNTSLKFSPKLESLAQARDQRPQALAARQFSPKRETKNLNSYSRVKAHLLRIHKCGIGVCSKVNDEYLAKLQLVVDLAENKIKPKHVPLLTQKYNSSLKRRNMGPLEKCFNTEDRDHLKDIIARMFYSFGLPFNLARNPYYVNSYLFAANHNLGDFLLPGYNVLRTTLLQQEKANVERLLKPIKSTWKSKGVSIVSDGWTDSQRSPLINFMATSEGSPIFLNYVDASEDIESRYYIAD
ncbi:hypothetical protein Lal_00018455 [Lupinus albus]|nr:hypothetical protein Lal_00018455 [Lupinus albus]